MTSPYFKLDASEELSISGNWILENYSELLGIKKQIISQFGRIKRVNFEQLSQMDTNGAFVLIQALGQECIQSISQEPDIMPKKFHDLLKTVSESIVVEPEKKISHQNFIINALEKTGRSVCTFFEQIILWLAFFGQTLEALLSVILRPRQWRWTAIIASIDSTGFRAVLIVMLLNFMVGAVIAFLGATVLGTFGATVYTVHLVTYSFLREFGVLLTSILIAGRSASAYAAQIGSMKVNEEIDAIKTNGVDPINLLVLPRIWALLISLPLLTFFAIVAGICGGLCVCMFMLNISPTYFFSIIYENISITHFFVGMSKAPIFAVVIAVTGCLEGFKVGGSAESVGHHTTASVVQSIFMVIMIDALAAIFFMEMGW